MNAADLAMGDLIRVKFCAERSRLVDLLAAAARSYSDSAVKLALCAGPHDWLSYLALRSDVVEKRVIAEGAQAALRQHKFEHGCSRKLSRY
jgi:hypothetical protein